MPANIEALFPVWNDASTWNLAPLAPITSQVFHGLSDSGYTHFVTRHNFSGWMQDDLRMGDNLTLNLGVRYDVDTNGHSETVRFLPWLPGDQYSEHRLPASGAARRPLPFLNPQRPEAERLRASSRPDIAHVLLSMRTRPRNPNRPKQGVEADVIALPQRISRHGPNKTPLLTWLTASNTHVYSSRL